MGGDKSAQVPGMVRGTGSSPSADCPSVEACSAASNFVARDMTYADGKLTGSITSNLCPGHETRMRHVVPQCTEQQIPDPAFAMRGPKAAPLLGRVGMTLKRGVNMYGPFDAGFADGQVCSGSDGKEDCKGGTDLSVCESHMEYVCETKQSMTLNRDMLMDSCGGMLAFRPVHCLSRPFDFRAFMCAMTHLWVPLKR